MTALCVPRIYPTVKPNSLQIFYKLAMGPSDSRYIQRNISIYNISCNLSLVTITDLIITEKRYLPLLSAHKWLRGYTSYIMCIFSSARNWDIRCHGEIVFRQRNNEKKVCSILLFLNIP